MNYKDISVEDLFFNRDISTISDDELNDGVLKMINASEKHFRGYIISGYPNNFR